MTQQLLRNVTLAMVIGVSAAVAQTPPPSDAAAGSSTTVRITQAVLAGGKTLDPGTYQIRFTSEFLTANPGQSPDAERWVEFVKDGAVVGRASATAWTSGGAVGTSSRPAGAARVEKLKNDNVLRVSLNHEGTRYLIHLPIAQ